ncbi:hypothetical protein LINGRAHAP2_LOCUS29801 [Linum grandiflorum]
MGNYRRTTIFPARFMSLVPVPILVLVLVLVSGSTTLPAASADPNYCGPIKATDPNFPGYAVEALDLAIDELVSNKDLEAGIAYPDPAKGTRDWAYALASCFLEEVDDCKVCLGDLLLYVRACSGYTSAEAYYVQKCSLGFVLQSWSD